MTDQPLKLGTRASPLALAQAHLVRDALLKAYGWDESRVVIVAMTASGDRILDRPLAEVGGKALWTKELDRALFEGDIDFAVHSMKDVETLRPPELAIVAMLPRADVRDRLIGASSTRSSWVKRSVVVSACDRAALAPDTAPAGRPCPPPMPARSMMSLSLSSMDSAAKSSARSEACF
jgi:hydroxymethylbilane synthase